MARPTFKTRAVVLRKTKLGEKDLIVTLLCEDGSLLKAVAKGARKPGGSLAAKMELFSIVKGMFAEGKNLAVVTDVRFSGNRMVQPLSMEQSACASAVAELLAALAQPDLPHARLFDLAVSAFDHIREESPQEGLAVCAGALLKILAMTGFRPHTTSCILCDDDVSHADGTLWMSIAEGGIICNACKHPADAYPTSKAFVDWCNALLQMRFDDIETCGIEVGTAFEVLQFVKQWSRVHVGSTLKSLDFLFSCGLF